MKKKKWIALVLMMVLVVFAACDNSEASESAVVTAEQMNVVEGNVDSQMTGAPADEMVVEVACVQLEDSARWEELTIYYSNGRADGLDTESMEAELSAEQLIDALAKHNVVSIDTKVLAFECVEEQGRTVLKLDLSKAFGEYLKTMGQSGEEVALAALTNTFLDNYQADGLWLMVEGKTLKTAHGSYDEELIFQ